MKQMSDINEVANQIEAILLATPEPLTKGEIAGKLNADIGEIGKAMNLLKKRYEGTALELKNYGKKYKIVIREEYSEIAYRYSELELNKGELEILAFLFKNKKAYLTQIKRLRGPKAIEEISHLEKLGYVKLERSGRFNMLRLTRSFIKKFGKEMEKALKEQNPEVENQNLEPSVQNGDIENPKTDDPHSQGEKQ